MVGNRGDRRPDPGRNLADLRQRRIETSLLEVGFADHLGQCMSGRHEHLVGHQPCLARDRAEPDAGEDVGIVALARHEGFAVDRDGIVGTAAGKQRAPAGVAVGLFGRAFGLRRRVGERENDRLLVDLGHRAQHLGRERSAHRRDADDRGRREILDRRQEIADRRMRVRVTKLLRIETGAVFDHQATGIHQPYLPARVGFAGAVRHHGRHHEIGDAGRGFARAEE